MRLANLTRPELIYAALEAADAEGVLEAFSERMAAIGAIPRARELYRKLYEREQLGSTGIGDGVAIPHCKLGQLDAPILAIGRLKKADGKSGGVDFGAVDGRPVHLFFLVVSPDDAPAEHLQVLAGLSRWLRADHHVSKVMKAESAEAIFELLEREGST